MMPECPVEPASFAMMLARPLVFAFDAEDAHRSALDMLRRASALPRVLDALASCHRVEDPRLRVEAMGLRFPNPLGVAAGLDKDAVALPALGALGFGFVEAGTVTPRPQDGNPRPRVFRLPEDGAAINRLGFPSEGASRVASRLAGVPRAAACVVGMNLGKNKETANERAGDDYVAALALLRPFADYVVVNVSSPNTPGLRALQDASSLRALAERVVGAAGEKPVLVKLSPDLHEADFDAAIDACLQGGARGLIVANTTITRPASLARRDVARETGGLSGAPLTARTEDLVRRASRRAGAGATIVGVGGVTCADDAWRLLRAGASLVQIYTGFIYGGPALPRKILTGLLERLDREGVRSVAEVTASAR